jgi:hypothetical protein
MGAVGLDKLNKVKPLSDLNRLRVKALVEPGAHGTFYFVADKVVIGGGALLKYLSLPSLADDFSFGDILPTLTLRVEGGLLRPFGFRVL